MIQQSRDAGVNPYPHKFAPLAKENMISVKECRDKYDSDKQANGTYAESVEVGVTGRAMIARTQGQKLMFIDLIENDAKVQILCTAEFYKGDFEYLKKSIRRGDIIGVQGHPGRANKGEFSIRANKIE
jgi:lysyl-tRNA synthetase class 2